MNRAEKITELHKRHGDRPIKIVLGTRKLFWITLWENQVWATILKGTNHYHVLLTNGETTHDPHCGGGPARGADFDSRTGERWKGAGTGAWESALSMWQVQDENKACEVFERVAKAIDVAHEQLTTRKEAPRRPTAGIG